jgi:hypothetical protein
VNTTTSKTQPALVGGLVLGVLSALPIIAAGNVCCCLWIISGGVVAAYLLQQNQAAPITAGDGALVGFLAGIAGAFVYLIISIPMSLIFGPMEREMVRRIFETSGRVPPEIRDTFGPRLTGAVRVAIGFTAMLVVGSFFATLGGLMGAVIFRKPLPPGTIDVPPST